MIVAGHHGNAADGLDGAQNGMIIGGDNDRPETRLHRTTPDMDDHRLATNIGERLAWQAGGSHAGGDENDGIGHLGRSCATF